MARNTWDRRLYHAGDRVLDICRPALQTWVGSLPPADREIVTRGTADPDALSAADRARYRALQAEMRDIMNREVSRYGKEE